jgi:hypothetical protein
MGILPHESNNARAGNVMIIPIRQHVWAPGETVVKTVLSML